MTTLHLKKMITVGSVMLSLLPKDGFTVENQQIASADLMSLSLEELMDVKVIVASKKEAALREAPGIITVVTAEEITHSGARDLIDVLRLVPGYDFGVHVSNLVGVAIRGQWAMDKVLLLIDGIEMNERRNASTEFGQHFPVEQISRIEIIRGPGSVMYGGSAELGVINIITKKAEELNGAVATASYGQLSKTFGHKNVNLMYGQSFDEIKVTAMGFAGRGHRSDREYKDGFGATVNMEDANELAPSFFNFGFQYKDFSARAIIDNYYNNNMDGLVKVRTQPTKIKMEVSSYELQYNPTLTDKLKLNSSFVHSYQSPLEIYNDKPPAALLRRTLVESYTGKLSFHYQARDNLSLVLGGEYNLETFDGIAPPRDLEDLNVATVFAEGMYKSALGNLTVGLRYDEPNFFDSNLAPRIGLTKVFDQFHVKALYSNSFRSPKIENYATNHNIKAETTQTYELEMGYQISKDMAIMTNIFNILSKDTIVFGINPADNVQSFYNSDELGTWGAEAEFRVKKDWGYLTLNYSYYQVTNDDINDYKVIDYRTNAVVDDNMRLAFPTHKLTLNGSYKVTPKFSINPSIVFYGSRYGYSSFSADGKTMLLQEYSPSMLASVFFKYDDFLVENLDVGLGIHNIFDEDYDFIQPYNSGHAPLPDLSREVMLKVSYQF